MTIRAKLLLQHFRHLRSYRLQVVFIIDLIEYGYQYASAIYNTIANTVYSDNDLNLG